MTHFKLHKETKGITLLIRAKTVTRKKQAGVRGRSLGPGTWQWFLKHDIRNKLTKENPTWLYLENFEPQPRE